MASGFFWKVLFSVISLSLAYEWNRQVCTKKILHKFNIYKYDVHSRRVVSEEKTQQKINFVCCEGYRERSRNKEFPNCVAMCKKSCGYGYCYRPNLCACYSGYEISAIDGTCKRIGSYEAVTKPFAPPMDTRFEVESSTRAIVKRPSWKVADLIPNKFTSNKISTIPTTSTTNPASTHHRRFEAESSTRQIDVFSTTANPPLDTRFEVESSTWAIVKKPSSSYSSKVAEFIPNKFTRNKISSTKIPSSQFKSLEVGSTREQINYPRVKFITYEDSNLGTKNPASTQHRSFEVESSTRQIDLKPSLITLDDFPMARFTRTHTESSIEGIRNLSNTQNMSFEVLRREPSVLKSLSDTAFAKFQTTKATQSKLSTIENIIDTIPISKNELKIPANCTIGICTCQMGYQIFEGRYCAPCRIGSQCQCPDGYAFDSFHCKPLCNGVLDGCIRGTCIEYNECSCLNGTEKFSDDLFRCYYVKEAKIINHLKKIDTKWYLLVLLIPAVIIAISFYIIVNRSKSSKSNRLKAQRNNFQEIRYFHTNNNFSEQKKPHKTEGMILDEPFVADHDGNILIVKV